MNVQVLVAAMNQKDHSLIDKMNIQTDVIVGNQCDSNSVERFRYKDHQVTYLNFAEKGVGLNRNNALMRATGDICLFADDDMVYEDGYAEVIEKAFNDFPRADRTFKLRYPNTTGSGRAFWYCFQFKRKSTYKKNYIKAVKGRIFELFEIRNG